MNDLILLVRGPEFCSGRGDGFDVTYHSLDLAAHYPLLQEGGLVIDMILAHKILGALMLPPLYIDVDVFAMWCEEEGAKVGRRKGDSILWNNGTRSLIRGSNE